MSFRIQKLSFLWFGTISFLVIFTIFSLNSSIENGPNLELSSSADYWEETWSGADGDWGTDIVLDDNNNLFILGRTKSYSNNYNDIVILKYSEDGQKLWNTSWGCDRTDYGSGIVLDSEENIFIAGNGNLNNNTYYDVFLAKFHNNGTYLWNVTWGYEKSEYCYDIVNDSQENIYLVGYTYGNITDTDTDIFLLKINKTGSIVWNRTWDSGLANDYAYGVAIGPSGNIYVAGTTNDGGRHIILLKYEPDGDLIITSHLESGSSLIGENLIFDSNGNLFVTGNKYNGGFVFRDEGNWFYGEFIDT